MCSTDTFRGGVAEQEGLIATPKAEKYEEGAADPDAWPSVGSAADRYPLLAGQRAGQRRQANG